MEGVSRVARGREMNLPQTRGGRMQQLCYKCARDVRLARAAEGGRLSPQGGRSTSGQKDLRTKGRAPIAEGTRCRAAKRRASDRRGSGAWRGAHPATEVTRNPRCRFSCSAGGGVLADLPCFGRAPALEHRREHVEPFLGEGLGKGPAFGGEFCGRNFRPQIVQFGCIEFEQVVRRELVVRICAGFLESTIQPRSS